MKNIKHFLIVLILFIFLTLSIFWPILVGKVNINGNFLVSFYAPYGQNLPYKNNGIDQLRIYFPFYNLTTTQLRNFSIPLWNPYAFSGHPHLADFQSAVLYPLNIFSIFSSQIDFWHLLRISSLFLAAYFTYLYLRSLRLSIIPSLFGSLTFGFSPFLITWGNEVIMSPHSILWMPLILYAVEKYLSTSKRIFLAIISIASAITLTAGYMQTTIYLFLFIFGYIIFRVNSKPFKINKSAVLIISSVFLGGLIASAQLLPSAQLFFNSARSSVSLKEELFKFLIPLEGLITYLSPDFFGNPATHNFFRKGSAQYYESIMFIGIAPLLFTVFAVIIKFKNWHEKTISNYSKLIIFLLTIALLSLLSTIKFPASELFLKLPIPFLSTSIANRILFIPAFCISILASIGMHLWLSGERRYFVKIISAFTAIYILIIFYLFLAKNSIVVYFDSGPLLSSTTANISLRNLFIPVIVFTFSSTLILWANFRHNIRKYLAVLIIILSFLHIVRFSQKYMSFSDKKYIFPQTPIIDYLKKSQGYFRSWGLGDAYFENNFASQYEIYWPEGFDSLNNIRYARFTHFFQHRGDLKDFAYRADAGIGRDPAENLTTIKSREKLLDLLGVKYIISKSKDEKLLKSSNYTKVFESTQSPNSAFQIWENENVLPRVFLASSYLIIKDDQQIIGTIKDASFDIREKIVLEKEIILKPESGVGTASIVSYKPQEVIIKTKSDRPKLLFLSDNYYPGWKVKVDGTDNELLRANYTFRAVSLSPGEHKVVFYFDSFTFKFGLLLSVLGIFTLLILIFKKYKFLERS